RRAVAGEVQPAVGFSPLARVLSLPNAGVGGFRPPAGNHVGAHAMLGRLVLLLLQVAIGWVGAPALMRNIQMGGLRRPFIFAVVAAIVVFLVGIIAAQVLREVAQPSSHTLSWAVVLALVAAAIWTWGPQFVPQLRQVQAEYAVLAGAILGYMIKR